MKIFKNMSFRQITSDTLDEEKNYEYLWDIFWVGFVFWAVFSSFYWCFL
jgi:hypothetical protein